MYIWKIIYNLVHFIFVDFHHIFSWDQLYQKGICICMKKVNDMTSIGKYILYIIYYIVYIIHIVLAIKTVPLELFSWFFFPDPANFSGSRGVGVQFLTVQICPEFEFFQNSSNTVCVTLNTNSENHKCYKDETYHDNVSSWDL